MIPAYLATIPSPDQGVWHLGPIPIRAYALCIIAGIIVAIWWGERRWAARGGTKGTVIDIAVFAVPFGLVGGRLYHVITDPELYFTEGKNPLERVRDLGRRPRHLGRHRPRRGGRADRVPPQGHPAAGDGGRDRPGHRRGAGHRPHRQLLQPGALRRAHGPAVGPGGLPALQPGRPGQPAQRRRDRAHPAAGEPGPPDVPVRADLEPAGRAAGGLGGPALQARARPGVRAVRRRATPWAAAGSR